MLSNKDSERAFLSGIINYGADAYFDILDIGIKEDDFTNSSHSVIFNCCKYLIDAGTSKIDVPSIFSAANTLGVHHCFKQQEEIEYLKSIIDYDLDRSNLRSFAQQVKKLSTARNIYKGLESAKEEISDLSGNESISDIFSILEDKLFNLENFLNEDGLLPTKMGEGLSDYIQNLIDNPGQQVGISSGLPIFDSRIGGGLRGGSVNIVAARPGIGKSTVAAQVSLNVSRIGIPVLYLFNEMVKEDFQARLLANLSDIPLYMIESSKFSYSTSDMKKIEEAKEKIESLPFYQKNIASLDFDAQLGIIKRWILKDVGIEKDGRAKTCLIIYDQLKMSDSVDINKNMQEYQSLGVLITKLDILANKYNIPILATCQLNRDGVTNESTAAISQSDRFTWLASSVSILKNKSEEEIGVDPIDNGNKKLIILKSRFGEGIGAGDYINLHMKGSCAQIKEGKTKFDLTNEKRKQESQIAVEMPAEKINA